MVIEARRPLGHTGSDRRALAPRRVSEPGVEGNDDGNESTGPVTANVWAEHSVWPQDPGFAAALAGGITTLQILPGSANLIGGRSVVLKNVAAVTYQAMKFPGAPQGLKMACGENPKRVYGSRDQFPSTRMGNVAGYRAQWMEAQEYIRDQAEYEKKLAEGDEDAEPVKRDARLDTLAGVLKGEIIVHQHCYRADEMATVLDMANEFGYRVAAFHHATEAYKIANLLAERGVCGAMWADWWGFKMESYDGIPENIAFVDAAPGGCAIVHSDSEEGIQRLNQEAAKAMAYGARAGFAIPPERAITWLTANAAKALGILERTGTLEPGKMADVVLWNSDSVQRLCAGGPRVDRRRGALRPGESTCRAGIRFQPGPVRHGGGSTAMRPVTLIALATLAITLAHSPIAVESAVAQSVLIRNATVHTMGARGVLAGADVLITDGRIAALGDDIPAPEGAEVVDAAGRPVTPGFFGGLGHLGVEEIGLEPSEGDYALALGEMRPEFDVTLAFNPASTAIGVNRIGGVTFAVLAPTAEAGSKDRPGGTVIAGQGAVVTLDGTVVATHERALHRSRR